MEDRLWPAGDWHWGIVAVAGLLVAFSPDIYDRLRSCWRKPEGRWITVGAVSSAVSWVVYLPHLEIPLRSYLGPSSARVGGRTQRSPPATSRARACERMLEIKA